jgi:fumarate hydratase class II
VERLHETLNRNPILIAALNSVIGYERAAAIAVRAYAEKRSIFEVALEMTDLSEQELVRLIDPAALTEGGIRS